MFFSAILVVVSGYALWGAWKFLGNAIFSGELLRRYGKFSHYHLQDQIGIILIPLGFLVPLCLAGISIYLLVIVFKRYFSKKDYYLVFSKNGVEMAGFYCHWKSMIWFGGQKTIIGKGVIPCWATKGVGDGVILHLPAIKPIPEGLFQEIGEEVRKRFSHKTGHFDELSWKSFWFDKDFPYKYRTETLIPWKSKKLKPCDILCGGSPCSSVIRPAENEGSDAGNDGD